MHSRSKTDRATDQPSNKHLLMLGFADRKAIAQKKSVLSDRTMLQSSQLFILPRVHLFVFALHDHLLQIAPRNCKEDSRKVYCP